MISQDDDTIIVHIPVEQTVLRFNGTDEPVYDLSQGMSIVEAPDAVTYFIDNPLRQWLIDVILNGTSGAGTSLSGQEVYFTFDEAGATASPGNDDNIRSITDDRSNS